MAEPVERVTLGPAMQRITIEVPGRGAGTQNMPCSFAIGMQPERARDALRAHWREPEQGTTVVRNHLAPRERGSRPHR